MTFWGIGDEEHRDPRFRAAGLDAAGLYYTAGSWCMGEIRLRRELPAAWYVPDYFVVGFPKGKRLAARLVAAGLWKRLDGGYEFAWLQRGNSPDDVRKQRKADREKPSRQRPKWVD